MTPSRSLEGAEVGLWHWKKVLIHVVRDENQKDREEKKTERGGECTIVFTTAQFTYVFSATVHENIERVHVSVAPTTPNGSSSS